MRKKIFLYAFLLGAAVLLLCAVLFFTLQYSQTVEDVYQTLEEETFYAAQGLDRGGTEYLASLGSVNRVCLFGPDGALLFDSAGREAPGSLSQAPELRAALENGQSRGMRGSEEDGSSTMYFALRCPDGRVLRLSRPTRVVRSAMLAVSPLLWGILLVLIFSGVVAFRAAKQILKPINELDLDSPDPAISYPELSPLIHRIEEQKNTLLHEAAERESLRKEFSANVSHELKTPLTSISGFAELMQNGLVPEEKVREFSGDIYRESQRLIALVDDIMRLSKLDEESGFPESELVPLYSLAEEVCESLRLQAEKRSVSLTLEGGPAAVRGVPTVLQEMLYNLVDNAIKYNREGGSVTLLVQEEGGRALVRVSDTGIGIPLAEQERVFERFYRVDKSHSKTIGGTGLGLSIVKHGAQLHHAVIGLESIPDKGTTITLHFPEPEERE